MDRLARQVRFLVEIDKLKHVLRRTVLMDGSRRENDAEHSWHLAMLAILLHEYAAEPVDLLRTVQMVIVHDLVEIDAGDTFCYDADGQVGRHAREQRAAERIFALLPADQATQLRALWNEFEAHTTAEAKFAAAIDRFQPLLHNYYTQGAAWREHGVRYEQVIDRNHHIAAGAPALWEHVRKMIEEAKQRGWLKE